jgi:hypothetical protein
MLVPNWARVKAAAIMNTPKRWPRPLFSPKNDSSRFSGFQIGSPPKITVDEEETMMPIKLVMANPSGIVNN